MKKPAVVFRCCECGAESPKWQGQCSSCKEWNTMTEEKVVPAASAAKVATHVARSGYAGSATGSSVKALRLEEVSSTGYERIKTGLSEFDRLMGGGIVKDSVNFISGEPGAGKSTMLLQICNNVARSGLRVLYAAGEESLQQIKMRADRLGIKDNENLLLISETCVESIIEKIIELNITFLIIDSIQTGFSTTSDSASGGVTQLVAVASLINATSKQKGVTSFLIGHVSKTGDAAGPKMISHIVDTNINLDSQDDGRYRIMRTSKNRFAATDSAFFVMTEKGIMDVKNPSAIFLEKRDKDFSGCAISVIRDGTRSLLVEIQSLIDTAQSQENPKRVCIGLDQKRMSLILAVINSRLRIKVGSKDIYISIVGGLKTVDTSTDLSVAISIISNIEDINVSSKIASFGEIGLLGEIRAVSNGLERIKEAEKLGFETIIIPERNRTKEVEGMRIKVKTIKYLSEVIELLK